MPIMGRALTSLISTRLLATIVLMVIGETRGAGKAFASALPVLFEFKPVPGGLELSFTLQPDNKNYYILDQSTDLTDFSPMDTSFGGGTDAWAFTVPTAASETMFWRVRRVPVTAALDLDGDGIDDAFELSHGLDPLDPSDATLDSGLVDTSNKTLNWLEAYRFYFTKLLKIFDASTQEVSIFNFGQSAASFEALTQEFSVFNGTKDSDGDGVADEYEVNHGLLPDNPGDGGALSGFADDRGLALTWAQTYRFNFGRNDKLYDSVTREVSIYNFGQPAAAHEALTRETSVFNGPPDSDGDGVADIYETNHGLDPSNAVDGGKASPFTDDGGVPLTWAQIYRFNFGRNDKLYDSVTREVAVFNFGHPAARYEGLSREVSIFNSGNPAYQYEAIAREVSVFNVP